MPILSLTPSSLRDLAYAPASSPQSLLSDALLSASSVLEDQREILCASEGIPVKSSKRGNIERSGTSEGSRLSDTIGTDGACTITNTVCEDDDEEDMISFFGNAKKIDLSMNSDLQYLHQINRFFRAFNPLVTRRVKVTDSFFFCFRDLLAH